MSLKVLLVGYGKMGRMVEEMAGQDIEIVGRVDEGQGEWQAADVAIDFSTASALLANFPKYVQAKMNVVIGTTGWGEHAARLRADAAQAGLGVVASANLPCRSLKALLASSTSLRAFSICLAWAPALAEGASFLIFSPQTGQGSPTLSPRRRWAARSAATWASNSSRT